MEFRLKRGRSIGRRVLLERQTGCFYLLWHPYGRKEESRTGGSTLGCESTLPNRSTGGDRLSRVVEDPVTAARPFRFMATGGWAAGDLDWARNRPAVQRREQRR